MEVKDFWELQGAGQALHWVLEKKDCLLEEVGDEERIGFSQDLYKTSIYLCISLYKTPQFRKISGFLK